MLHRTNFGKSLLVFLLSANFMLGWAVCVVLCDEAAEHGAHASISAKQLNEERCLGSDEPETDCRLTASDAILQDRPTFESTVEAAEFDGACIRAEVRARLNLPPAKKQHSPPFKSPIPIFVRLCSFRI